LSVCVEESWQYSTSLQRESRGSTTQAWWPTRDSQRQLNLEHFGESPAWHPANYQRFFNGGPGSNAFRVRTQEQKIDEDDARETVRQAHVLSKGDFIVEEVLRRLADHEEKVNDEGAVLSEATDKTQISPWLEGPDGQDS
jgi:hypothetical protein